MKKWIGAAGLSALVFSLMWAMPAVYGAVVPEGLSVGGQQLGGLETEEAKQKIEDYVSGLSAQTVSLDVDGTLVETTAEDLGFCWDNTDVVEESVKEYHTGNIIERYMKQKDLSRDPVDVELELKINGDAVAGFVEEQCAPFVREAQDASIVRENGQFVVTPSQTGIAVDLEETTAALNAALESGLTEPVTVKAAVVVTEPVKTTEMLSQIQDVLGTFSTDFSSSGQARATNLKVGSSKINGRVLMPGETLSGYECMQPFTRANGYAAASAYENGQVVDSIGGGVCQIATTLYNAALFAELEITQRQNHSMVVSYVPPSNDAAIAGTYKDIKVTNPYDTPVYVEAGTSGRTLTFTIYGKETRPANRTLKFKSETLSVQDPGEPITRVDPSLAPGARVRVQSSHRGLRSRLWKCVYIDGVETEKTLLHTDTYNASKAVYRVGPEAPVQTVPPEGTGGEGTGSAPEGGGQQDPSQGGNPSDPGGQVQPPEGGGPSGPGGQAQPSEGGGPSGPGEQAQSPEGGGPEIGRAHV